MQTANLQSVARSGTPTLKPPVHIRRSRGLRLSVHATAAPVEAQAEDKWIARALSNATPGSVPLVLQNVRNSCVQGLSTMRVPTTRNEDYRFTDLTSLLKNSLQAGSESATVSDAKLEELRFGNADSTLAVIVNGRLRKDLSQLSGLPSGVFIGSAAEAPQSAVVNNLGAQSGSRGGPFATLNGALAGDVLVIHAAAGIKVDAPIHVLNISTGAADEAFLTTSAPRLLVVVEAGSRLEVVEEFSPADPNSGKYFTCALAEVVLGQGASFQHGYVQREAAGAVHMKGTLVQQDQGSQYSVTEATLGGTLTRHDLGITQLGAGTSSVLRHFLLCGPGQLHDLHSRLELNAPRGHADQLHKCIVSAASGRGVFDGNVKVNKAAQQTDAGQLSRNLLLVPLATVNVKPNLQIIADDVRCTHGCTVSDLSAEELFYFRARGISAEQAREALVFSFGSEVVQQLKHERLVKRLQQDVAAALAANKVSSPAAAGNSQ